MVDMIGDIFTESDLDCNCGCGYFITNKHMIDCVDLLLRSVEESYGDNAGIEICSWCRCPMHNSNVGGVKGSQHTKGRAIDVKAYYHLHGEKVYLPGKDLLAMGSKIFDRGYHINWGSRKACHFDIKYHPEKRPFKLIKL